MLLFLEALYFSLSEKSPGFIKNYGLQDRLEYQLISNEFSLPPSLIGNEQPFLDGAKIKCGLLFSTPDSVLIHRLSVIFLRVKTLLVSL